ACAPVAATIGSRARGDAKISRQRMGSRSYRDERDARYPRLKTTVVAGPTRDVLRFVMNNEADLAYVNGPIPTSGSVLAVDIACPSSLIGFSPRTLGSAPKVVRAQDLVDKPFIYYAPGTVTHELVHKWFHQSECKTAASMEFDSGLSILALVDAGI